ncbi:MAG: deoxyribose-phosphate aldolase [Candidatus Hydrothermarchaeota archaeon]
MIDYTNLNPNAIFNDIEKLCNDAKRYGFGAVCVAPYYIRKATKMVNGTDIKVCSTVGFPFGYDSTETKVFETKKAIEDGALEIDMVMNRCAFKNKEYDVVREDIESVVKAAKGRITKVIIETCDLNRYGIEKACKIVEESGAHFVKTSTGFGKGGAKVEDVKLIKEVVGPNIGIKASGGVRTFEYAIELIKAGATRIGTSAGVKIIEGYKESFFRS